MSELARQRQKHLVGAIIIAASLIALAVGVLTGSKWHALVVIVVFGLCLYGSGEWIKFKTLTVFKNRLSLTDAEVFEQFYGAQGASRALVDELWREVAATLDVPQEKMRPGDKLEDLGKRHLFLNGELDELTRLAIKRAATAKREVNLSKVSTVNDYVKLFL